MPLLVRFTLSLSLFITSLAQDLKAQCRQDRAVLKTAKRAYLSILVNPPPSFLPPATIKPYDKPDASQIIASLAARTMGHRSSMSNALSQSFPNDNNVSHNRTLSTNAPGSNLNTFQMPGTKTHRASTSSISGLPPSRSHQRTGSASSSWQRSGFGNGGGVLNFSLPTSSAPRLATHSESSDPSRSSSTSEGEPIIVMDSALPRTGTKIPNANSGGRRESVSADKALREVQKALASVEAAG